MKLRSMFLACALWLLLLCFLSASAEGTGALLTGAWVYENDPTVSVVTLREDGTALFGGQELIWAEDKGAVLLTDAAGASFRLVCAPVDDGMLVWLPTRFTRISEIGADGEITGTWKAEGKSRSSFVFTENGRFLEDGVFTGSFRNDPEQGRVTLQYAQGMFEDTVILYSFDGSTLVIAYPWKLVRK